MAAGPATRWTGATPKHLVSIEGEVLLERTIRQVVDRHATVHVLIPTYDEYGAHLAGAWSTKPYWPGVGGGLRSALAVLDGPGVVLWGDVWYSEQAADTILAPRARVGRRRDPPAGWYGRRRPSVLSGRPDFELFSLAVPGTLSVFAGLVWAATVAYETRPTEPAGWTTWDLLGRRPITTIDDWTDDFDTVEQLEHWLERRVLLDVVGMG